MAIAQLHNPTDSLRHAEKHATAHFDAAEQLRMEKDDSTAFSIVSIELLSIVTLGFVLVLGTVLAIVYSG